MICEICGNEMGGAVKFCPLCGTNLMLDNHTEDVEDDKAKGKKYEVEMIHKYVGERIGFEKEMEAPNWLEDENSETRIKRFFDACFGFFYVCFCFVSIVLGCVAGGIAYYHVLNQYKVGQESVLLWGVYGVMLLIILFGFKLSDFDISWYLPWLQVGASLILNYGLLRLMELGYLYLGKCDSVSLSGVFVVIILILGFFFPTLPILICLGTSIGVAEIWERIIDIKNRDAWAKAEEERKRRADYLKEYRQQEQIHKRHEYVNQQLTMIKNKELFRKLVTACELYEMEDYKDALYWVRNVLEQYLYCVFDTQNILLEDRNNLNIMYLIDLFFGRKGDDSQLNYQRRKQADTLHRIRVLCNKGTHGLADVKPEETKEAILDMIQLLLDNAKTLEFGVEDLISDMEQKTESYLQLAYRNIENNRPEGVYLNGRRAAECIVNGYLKINQIRCLDGFTDDLQGHIDLLHDKGCLSKQSQSNMHIIRHEGNMTAHINNSNSHRNTVEEICRLVEQEFMLYRQAVKIYCEKMQMG